jgi:ABC-type nickel/cobalt efflux system permease component RcnA
MKKTVLRATFALIAVAYVTTHFLGHAHAQSSLGIGTAEPSIAPSGFLASFFQWVNVYQQSFYRSMTAALKGMRADGTQLWLLIGLSFAYGIFHAAGPGHGKVVIASYIMANKVALRRGIVLSVISSLLQGLSAVVMIGMVFLFLRGTSISMTKATWFLELASYFLVALYGAWLLARKLRPLLPALMPRPALATSGAPIHNLFDAQPACEQPSVLKRSATSPMKASGFSASEATSARMEVCYDCGLSHAVDPSRLQQDHLDLRSAWAAIIAVGLRPCSGALIVLTFSLLNGLWFGGIVSVFAMALGTAITVSVLATLSVMAKNVALTLSGEGSFGATVHTTIEIVGAAALLLIGLVLIGASLSV